MGKCVFRLWKRCFRRGHFGQLSKQNYWGDRDDIWWTSPLGIGHDIFEEFFSNFGFFWSLGQNLSTHTQNLSTFLNQISKSIIFLLSGSRSSVCRVFYRPVHHFRAYVGDFSYSPPFSRSQYSNFEYSKFEYFSLWAREFRCTVVPRPPYDENPLVYGMSDVWGFRGDVGSSDEAPTGCLYSKFAKIWVLFRVFYF